MVYWDVKFSVVSQYMLLASMSTSSIKELFDEGNNRSLETNNWGHKRMLKINFVPGLMGDIITKIRAWLNP